MTISEAISYIPFREYANLWPIWIVCVAFYGLYRWSAWMDGRTKRWNRTKRIQERSLREYDARASSGRSDCLEAVESKSKPRHE